MKKNWSHAKKIILVGIVVVVSVVAVLFLKNRFSMGMFSRSMQGVDLIIVNDSAGNISSAYKEDGKEVDNELKPGDEVTGGKGFIRIYTAKRNGSYELSYAYPRPSGTPQKVTLSQIAESAQKKNLGDDLYTEKGMIGDIKVEYEEVRELD